MSQLHITLYSTDVEATAQFLDSFLAMKVTNWEKEGKTYRVFQDKPEEPTVFGDIEGHSDLPNDPTCVVYFQVDDADQAVIRAIEAGAVVYEPVKMVGGQVRIGILKMPGGGHIGIWSY